MKNSALKTIFLFICFIVSTSQESLCAAPIVVMLRDNTSIENAFTAIENRTSNSLELRDVTDENLNKFRRLLYTHLEKTLDFNDVLKFNKGFSKVKKGLATAELLIAYLKRYEIKNVDHYSDSTNISYNRVNNFMKKLSDAGIKVEDKIPHHKEKNSSTRIRSNNDGEPENDNDDKIATSGMNPRDKGLYSGNYGIKSKDEDE